MLSPYSIVAMGRNRPILSALALGLCINVKYLWPLLLMIILARHAGRGRRCVVFVTATLAVVRMWVAIQTSPIPPLPICFSR